MKGCPTKRKRLWRVLDNWADCWTDIDDDGNETPTRFTSRAAAIKATKEFIRGIARAIKDGDMEGPVGDRANLRIALAPAEEQDIALLKDTSDKYLGVLVGLIATPKGEKEFQRRLKAYNKKLKGGSL